MRRKLFTFLVAFLATLSGAVWGQETTIDLSTPSVSGDGASIDNVTKTITIDRAENYVITGSTTEYQVLIGSTSGTGTVNVTLSDATIKLSKSFTYPIRIIERNTLDVILNIEGENVVSTTGGQAGITVPYGSSMTISGTGILNTSGHCGIGNANNAIAGGVCGNITISSGTVVVNGSAWCIGGYNDVTEESALQSPTLAMTGDALLVVHDDADNRDRGIFNMNYWGLESHPDHGIYCNAKAQAGADQLVGSLYDKVTLSSPFPNDDFVVDLNGNTLTLGEGSYARKNQITGLDGSGKLNAYEVEYNINKPNDLTSVSPTTVESMYYGPNAPLTTINPTINPVNTYTYWGWALDNEITSFSPKGNVNNGIEKKEVKAVWVVKARTITTDSGTEITPFDLVSPKDVNGFSFELIESTTLPSGLQLNSNTISGTLNESEITKYKAKNGGKEEIITLNFDAKNTQIDISEEGKFILSVENADKLVYNGAVQRPNVQVLDVEANKNLTPDVNYTVAYEPSEVKNAGTYKVTVTGKGAYKGTLTKTFEIQKATASVTAKTVEWTIGTPGPTFTDALTVQGVGKDQLTAISYTAPTGPWTEAGVYKVTYTNIKLNDEINYEQVPDVTDKLIVKKEGTEQDPITPGGPEDEETEIKIDGDNWRWDTDGYTRVYDGKTLSLKKDNLIYVKQKKDDNTYEWKAVPASVISVISVTPDSPIKNVDTYTVKLSIAETEDILYSGIVGDIKLVITACPITVTLGGLNAEHIGKDNLNANDFVTDWGDDVAEGETGKISGTISVAAKAIDGKYQVTFSDLALVDNDNFLKNNYTATFLYETTEIVGGNGEIEIEIPDWKPGEDIKPGESGWTWDEKSFTRVYDGKEHPITSVQIKQGEDWKTVSVSNVTYVPKQPVKDAGLYWATFTVEGKKAVLPLKITEREMKVTFNVPNHIESTDPITITDEYVNYEAQSGNRGLVTNEAPEIESGEFVFEESSIEGKYKVILRNFVLGGNADFKPTNYKLQIWDATQGKYVEYDNTGDDITIIDPEKPEGNPNTPGEGVVVGPDDEGQQPSKNFCNIYVVEESSPYIQFNPSRKVVEAVGQITVDVVIPDEIGIEDVKLTFRRGNGEWETLTIDEETQKYTIKDINTHIYLKAEVDAALLDAEPDENHVYIDLSCTKDGIKLDADREIVENGGDVLIKAEVSKENQNKAIKYEYKVTRFGAWKELKASGKAGEFMIWNVTNDIFVRAYLADQAEDPETAKEAHHVYSDLSVTCEGLYLDADRKMVDNNGTTKVYLTIEPNCNAKNAHYMFRRGIDEAWEELTPSTEANVFVITGIESDIYLKATDAISTGMEDIDGTARIYTKDGSLYIYTPQQDDITVVSMTGAVVKRTKQIGLQSYPLNQGIYVVRVGEQVFKVRVK